MMKIDDVHITVSLEMVADRITVSVGVVEHITVQITNPTNLTDFLKNNNNNNNINNLNFSQPSLFTQVQSNSLH